MQCRTWLTAALARRHSLRWQTILALAGARRVLPGGVGLSFDDGPHPTWTPQVLDVLADLDVQATFFCVGRNAVAQPQLVRRIVADGHALGSHSMTHPYPDRLTTKALRRDYANGRNAVEQAAQQSVVLFRPPHGHIGVRSALVMRRARLSPWLWSVDPEDWKGNRDSTTISTVACRANAGDVVLLHDWVEQPESERALDRSATVRAVPEVAAALRLRGLEFRVLPE